jgi:hypothetical protein
LELNETLAELRSHVTSACTSSCSTSSGGRWPMQLRAVRPLRQPPVRVRSFDLLEHGTHAGLRVLQGEWFSVRLRLRARLRLIELTRIAAQ